MNILSAYFIITQGPSTINLYITAITRVPLPPEQRVVAHPSGSCHANEDNPPTESIATFPDMFDPYLHTAVEPKATNAHPAAGCRNFPSCETRSQSPENYGEALVGGAWLGAG